MEDIAETEARLLTMRMNAEMALICGNLVAPDVQGVYPHWPHDAYAAEAKKTSRVIGSASHSMSRAEC